MVLSSRTRSKITSCLMPFKVKRLHQYIQHESWLSACAHCKSHPDEAGIWTYQHGFYEGKMATEVLPIHMACCLQAPLSIFQCLIDAFPESAKAKEVSYRRFPIHLACMYGLPLDIVTFLLSYFASGISACDAAGRTPIFYASARGLSLEVIENLVRTCPEAARIADYKGWLPIHVACDRGAPDKEIMLLLEAYPESWCVQTKCGNLPKIPPDFLSRWRNGRLPSPREALITSNYRPVYDIIESPVYTLDMRNESSSHREEMSSGQILSRC